MPEQPHNSKEIQLRKRLYSRLAYCLRVELKYLAIGSKWAAYYQQEARRVRLRLRGDLRKKVYPPLVRCVVFYPKGAEWLRYEFWTSRPENLNVSPGMQNMIDGLLKKESPAETIPQIIHLKRENVRASQMMSY